MRKYIRVFFALVFSSKMQFATYISQKCNHISSVWPPQYLADQLTLLQPGRADYPHLLLQAPPKFFTFRHH